MVQDLIRTLERAVENLDRLGIRYVIGDSLASSAHGEPRPSGDADLVVDLSEAGIPGLIAAFQGEFYVSESAAREAVARQTSFNLVHFGTVLKLDFFVAGHVPLRRLQLDRGRPGVVDPSSSRKMLVSTPEDIVLQKLDWYRKGGGVSDLQWRDIQGVLKLQGTGLDRAYLDSVASQAGLEDLLARAMRQAGLR